MKENSSLEDFLHSIERKNLSEEQQMLLTFGGNAPNVTINNTISGCSTTNNCENGNCGNCVKGCAG